MSITKSEYDKLLIRRNNGEIQFLFDPAQIKNFLYQLDNGKAIDTIGDSLLFESRIIRSMNAINAISLLVSIIAGFVWLNWWGASTALGLILFWMFLTSSSSGGKQHIVFPLIVSLLGFFTTFYFQYQGAGFTVLGVSTTLLYLSVKMSYALPTRLLSRLIISNYKLFDLLYENPIDGFNKELGVPMLWHVETKID
jgi:hypothetical protein